MLWDDMSTDDFFLRSATGRGIDAVSMPRARKFGPKDVGLPDEEDDGKEVVLILEKSTSRLEVRRRGSGRAPTVDWREDEEKLLGVGDICLLRFSGGGECSS